MRFAYLLLATLALPACGGTETAEAGEDATRTPVVERTAVVSGDAPAATTAPDAGVTAQAQAPAATSSPTSTPTRGASSPVPGAPATAATAPDAAAILARASNAYEDVRTMEADFVQQLSVPLLGTDQQSRGKFYQRKPDRILLRFTDPAGDVLVGDGQYFWMYYPSTDATQVIRASVGEGRSQADLQREFLSNPTERYVATLLGEESVNGRPAHLLTLVPKGQSPYKLIKIWVDKQDALVRRFEMTEENESVRRIEFRNLKLNAPVPDALFEFTPPPGTQVFEQ